MAADAAQRGDWQAADQYFRVALADSPASPSLLSSLAVVQVRLGKLCEAETLFYQATVNGPCCADAHFNLGNLYRLQNRHAAAADEFRRALEAAPEYAEAHFNLANTCRDLGCPDQAIDHYRHALRLRPHYLKATTNLANVLIRLGQVERATQLLESELSRGVFSAPLYYNLGLAYHASGRAEAARDAFERSIAAGAETVDAALARAQMRRSLGDLEGAASELREFSKKAPPEPRTWCLLGEILQQSRQFSAAIDAYERAGQLGDQSAPVLNNLGTCLLHLRQYDRARDTFTHVLAASPANAAAHNNLGAVLMAQGRHVEAIPCFEEAIRCDPGNASAYSNLGSAHQGCANWKYALQCYEQALGVDPDGADAKWNRGLLRLSLGQFAEAWDDYECRWQRPEFAGNQFRRPRQAVANDVWTRTAPIHCQESETWDGRPLDGESLCLYAEQGLGDTIQFVRYARLAKSRGACVIVECQECLAPLLRTNADIDVLVPRGEALPAHRYSLPLLSAPRSLGTTRATIPNHTPYLGADTQLVVEWRKVLAAREGLRIGIHWQGNPLYFADTARSVPLAAFERIAALTSVRLISLQRGFGEEQVAKVPFHVECFGPDFDKASGAFMDSAAVLNSLDLLITSDSAIAHVAGALAIRTWLVLPRVPDWRWGIAGERTPWYPTMRLFRQRRHGDWDNVFRRVLAAVKRHFDIR